LAAEGLVVHLADEFIVGINWLFSQAVGGVSVLVAEADAREAVAALAEDRTEELFEDLALGKHEIETCPSCGSVAVAYRSRRVALAAWLAVILLFTLLITLELLLYVGLVPWILNRPRWLCRKCGSTFRDL
jgi:ribosomal protein S27AE